MGDCEALCDFELSDHEETYEIEMEAAEVGRGGFGGRRRVCVCVVCACVVCVWGAR